MGLHKLCCFLTQRRDHHLKASDGEDGNWKGYDDEPWEDGVGVIRVVQESSEWYRRQKLSHFRSVAVAALWFAESFGLVPDQLTTHTATFRRTDLCPFWRKYVSSLTTTHNHHQDPRWVLCYADSSLAGPLWGVRSVLPWTHTGRATCILFNLKLSLWKNFVVHADLSNSTYGKGTAEGVEIQRGGCACDWWSIPAPEGHSVHHHCPWGTINCSVTVYIM